MLTIRLLKSEESHNEHIGRNLLNTLLHILMINRVISLPTVSYGYSELNCRSRARSGASRKSGGAERSSERELQKNDAAERGVRGRVAEWERSGERGLQK